ncbi:MAG: sensor histidine kinase [Bacteroidales bacterium]|nr:sensor histidine kinase [Bacteroidales bacterium]
MQRTDPRNLSLYVSLIIVAFFTIIYFIFSYLFFEIVFLPILIFDLILFTFCYFVFKFFLEKFIYEKIRVIYKTIHNLKISKDDNRKPEKKTDIIDDVNQEVLAWEKIQKKEIEQLKEQEGYRREFLGNISHELKTPIFNIQGYVLTLLDGGLEDPSINKLYLRRTEKSINRMIAIVEDLETIAQFETRDLFLEMKEFDIVALVKDVVEFLEMKARKKSISIYFREKYEKPLLVVADQKRIRQVLINLIDNSIKYCASTDPKTKISFFDMDENILMEVTDNGVGIAQEDLPRVFERFYRTDKARSRDQGGTGLGLAIVKHIIEGHNQTINVRSSSEIGSTFAFTLKKA